jgi:hypothetical protein
MKRDLPPIFSKARFDIAKKDVPAVLFRFDKDHIDDARRTIAALTEEIPLYTYAHCWMETPWTGMLVYCPDEVRVQVTSWNNKGKRVASFWFSDFTEKGLSDLEIICKAQYFQAAYTLHKYTEAAAEVSVNTLSRNAPSAYRREGDTLRFAKLDDLRSAAGQARQRDYERPDEPSGIRMREHDVRGHWRTFPSGARVWVRAHKRGDASLGRVTRVLQ